MCIWSIEAYTKPTSTFVEVRVYKINLLSDAIKYLT